MCTNGRWIYNRFSKQKVWVRCGKCDSCKQENAMKRTNRIRMHQRAGYICLFVTLTYTNDFVPYVLKSELNSSNFDVNVYRNACGSLVVNESITKYNAIMRAPNGEITTQYTLAPSEYTGLIKYDVLCTKTCGMIQIAMELLIEHGKMEWQGSLRATYDKYLHPDVIDSTSYDMWERLCRGELISAFQMDGDVKSSVFIVVTQ